MKILCTIRQGGLGTDDGTHLAHRLCFDFLTRIGIDGKDGTTPHIGPDGNWWIGAVNTRVSSKACRSFSSQAEFPASGLEDTLYLDTQQNKLYRWDAGKHAYRVIGKHFDQIAIIDGGNA